MTGAVEVRGDTAASEEAFAAKADGAFGNVAWHLDYVSRETDDVDIDGYATRTSIRREEAEEGEPIEEEKGTLANSDSRQRCLCRRSVLDRRHVHSGRQLFQVREQVRSARPR